MNPTSPQGYVNVIRIPPPNRLTSEGILQAVLALGASVALVATDWPGPHRDTPAWAKMTQDSGPLSGGWRTIANGDRINEIVRDGDVLWSATSGGGVVRWDLASGTYTQYLAPQDGLASNHVNDVAILPDHSVWAATDRGLARLPAGGTRFSNYTPENLPGMPARVVTALEPTADGHLWVGFAQEWDPVTVDPKSRLPGTFRKGGAALFYPADRTWTNEYHARLEGSIGSGGTEKYIDLPSENITDIEVGSDGIVWFGTRPYYTWDPNELINDDPNAPKGFWVLAGGGLAGFDGSRWKNWLPTGATSSCFSSTITDLAPDVSGRMWVGTAGRGVLLMRSGLGASGCGTGQPYYTRAVKDKPGLRGNYVWSVDVDETGRVWVGHGEGYDRGLGIGILTHNNTFDDSSATPKPWERGDDVWEFVDLDSQPGDSLQVITALWVRDPGLKFLGTRSNRLGDGDGIRSYDPATSAWRVYRTADAGLASNQIVSIAHDPERHETWFAFRNAGVARYDGSTWRRWRAFGPGVLAGTVKLNLPPLERGHERIPVTIPDKATFDALFPGTSRYCRIGDDGVLYRITKYTAERSGSGPYIDIEPPLRRATAAGTPVYTVDRGPASDTATDVAIDSKGRVWIGGRETVWLGEDCASDRAALNECWLDGGLGKWDGNVWIVYWQDDLARGANTIPDQEIQSVAVGKDGRVWVGTGNAREAEGDGVAVLQPETGLWMSYTKANQGSRLGGDGAADIAIDPETGDVWVAHHAATACVAPPFGGPCSPTRVGGGVSHFDGSVWEAWTKPTATLKAFGNQGELGAIHVDRTRQLVWAGGYDGDSKTLHWNSGYGVHAVLNWCPLDCTNTGWQNILWPEEGMVAAIQTDGQGNLWAGVNRSGMGIQPPVAGIKLFDGTKWYVYTPENSGLPSNEITALSRSGEDMWVGTLSDGVSLYSPQLPPTPEPTAEVIPTATPTEMATATREATESPSPTTPAASQTPTRPVPTATRTPMSIRGCASRVWRGWCDLFLPFGLTKPTCPQCTPAPPAPTPYRERLLTATATVTVAATSTATELPSATATESVSPTPTALPSETPNPATTVPPTDTATPTQAPTATASVPRAWQVVGSLPRVTYNDVFGTDPQHVWLIGDRGTVLFWDGTQMYAQTVPVTSPLRRGVMVTASQGFLVGDESVILSTNDGGGVWRPANRGGYADAWKAVDAVQGPTGLVGWILGSQNGTRLLYDGTLWAPTGPADRNTGHVYSSVAMISPTSAVAVVNAAGARMYTWDGSAWSPGVATGALADVHVRSATLGMAVGARANVWQLEADGRWVSMSQRPSTGGRDLLGVHVVSAQDIWAVGARAGLYHWDGASWTTVSLGSQTRDLNAVWLSEDGSQGWAVGADGLVVRYQ